MLCTKYSIYPIYTLKKLEIKNRAASSYLYGLKVFEFFYEFKYAMKIICKVLQVKVLRRRNNLIQFHNLISSYLSG